MGLRFSFPAGWYCRVLFPFLLRVPTVYVLRPFFSSVLPFLLVFALFVAICFLGHQWFSLSVL